MTTRLFPIAALLAAGLAPAPAPAAPAAASAAAPAAPAGKERERIEALMRRAVEAARKEAEAAQSAPGLDPDDRRHAQAQFARILLYAEGCEPALRFVEKRPEILGVSVKMLVAGALSDGDRECALAFVPLLLERWQDPYYVPDGRIGLKYYAGAVLDSSGRPEGRRIMQEAEARLAAQPDSEFRWNARWRALDAYARTPALGKYLEYLAGLMVSDPLGSLDSKRNGLLTLFAHQGRCDLVERVTKAGPRSCDEPRANARLVYGPPSPSQVEGARVLGSWLGVEEPTLDEAGLRKALTDAAPWGRVSKLMVFVSYCRWVLDGRLKPGGA